MERHDLNDDLERRLRAARPPAATVAPDAFDGELLARVRAQAIAPTSRRGHVAPRAVAVPAVLGVALAASAALLLAGGPDDVGGPSSAQALTQTLRWLDPPAGSILHVRSVETQDGHTRTSELWQSADDPAHQRMAVDGAQGYEITADALYDPANDTIYDAPKAGLQDVDADKGKQHAVLERPALKGLTSGDPVVEKVRTLLQAGEMHVAGREVHDGVETWAVTLNADEGRPAWTLWVAADDGKPVELRDPGRDTSEAPQVIRWPTYEVVRGGDAGALLTLTGAHPSARVVHDLAQTEAARDRLIPPQG